MSWQAKSQEAGGKERGAGKESQRSKVKSQKAKGREQGAWSEGRGAMGRSQRSKVKGQEKLKTQNSNDQMKNAKHRTLNTELRTPIAKSQ